MALSFWHNSLRTPGPQQPGLGAGVMVGMIPESALIRERAEWNRQRNEFERAVEKAVADGQRAVGILHSEKISHAETKKLLEAAISEKSGMEQAMERMEAQAAAAWQSMRDSATEIAELKSKANRVPTLCEAFGILWRSIRNIFKRKEGR